MYHVPEKYRCPSDRQIHEVRELRFDSPKFNTSSLKGFRIFHHCKNGWYVISVVDDGIMVTIKLGRVEF